MFSWRAAESKEQKVKLAGNSEVQETFLCRYSSLEALRTDKRKLLFEGLSE